MIRSDLAGVVLALPLLAACSAPEPTVSRMKADLVGKTIGDPFFGGFQVSSPGNFSAFNVRNTVRSGSVVTYQVHAGLLASNASGCTADLTLSYRRSGMRWELANTQAPQLVCERGGNPFAGLIR